jgi:protein TonB
VFFIIADTRRSAQQPVDYRLLLWCFVVSIALHAALLRLMPEFSAAHEAPAKPLTVEFVRPEPPPVAEPPKPEPARVIAPAKPQVQQQPEPRQQPKAQEKSPPVMAIPPFAAAPAETPPPAFTVPVPEPAARAPEPPRASPPPAVTAPRVRSDAAYLHNPAPAYPMAARRRGDQGTVMVRVTVSSEGLPIRVSLEKTSGTPALDESALNALRSWRFVPARENGQAVEALYIVPVVYKLN